MDPRKLPIDTRFTGFCVFCGGENETKDHVPSKILVDDPFPANVPVVESCLSCNNGFSLDEEYFACFLESVICGSVEPNLIRREKVRAILSRKPILASRILSSRVCDSTGLLLWEPEKSRIEKIIVKLAKGHAAYELSLPQTEAPTQISFYPIDLLSEVDRNNFEGFDEDEIVGWPEF